MNIADRILAKIAAAPRLSALLFGAVAATGFPPLSFWPLALIGVAGLGWIVLQSATPRQAAFYGWLFGIGHFTVANNWIATAFTYQSDMPASLGWLAVPLISLFLAIYPALACALAKLLLHGRSSGALILAFGGSWTISEWLRSWIFTGYAWDPLGLILLGPFDRPGAAMILPWVGTYALSGIVAGLSAALLWALLSRRLIAGLGMIAIVLAVMFWPAPPQAQGSLAFTLVQPDVRQDVLDDPGQFEAQFLSAAALSRKRDGTGKRLLLWPESGVPDYLRGGYPQRYYDQMTAAGDPDFARYRLGKVAGEGGLMLTGAVDLEIAGGRAVGARNAVTALNSDGQIVAGYDKAHLVPFGEYLALRWLLEPLGAQRFVAGSIDFIPGTGPETLELGDWGKAGIQICYEIIFSGQVVDQGNRPDYIFNPSNDGWFGSWGPPQHLAQARMRAIEEGLPVLRSTTTGISAVIDANGIVRQHIGMHRAARIDGMVPPAKPPTLFARQGNSLPVGLALLAMMISLAGLVSPVARLKRRS